MLAQILEATQQLLLDQCSDLLAIVDARRPGYPILAANQPFRALFALPAIGDTHLLDAVAARVAHRDLHGAIRAAIDRGETIIWEDVPLRRSRDEAIPGRWRWQFRPTRDADGDPAQIVLVLTEAAPHAINDDLGTVLDALPEGVLIVDRTGRVERINQAARQYLAATSPARGQLLGDLIGTRVLRDEHGDPCEPARVLHALKQTDTQTPVLYLHLGGNETAHQGHILALSAVTLTAETTFGSTIVIMRDVSEQKREEAEKDSFLSLISHEIKSPLTSIKGFSQLALRAIEVEADPLPRAMRHLRVIEQQAGRIGHLISDISDVSRLQRGKLPLDPTLFDFVAVVRTVAEQQAAAIHSHAIIFDAPDAPLIVRADPRRIQQIAENLITNAAKYSPHADTVTVRIAAEGAHARLAVEDSGIGISAADQARIFDRFYRTGGGHAAGLGLGLYIAHQVAALSGGALTVESTPGEGSTFSLDLPLAEPADGDD